MDRKVRLKQLLIDAKAGDEKALESLLWEHFNDLCRYLTPQMPADLTALISTEDVVSQTFYEAFRDFRQFCDRPDGTFTAWLKTIARNRLIDSIRKLRKGENRNRATNNQGMLSDCRDLVEMLADDGSTASFAAKREEAEHALRSALHQLSDDRYDVIVMRYVDDLAIDEIAERLGKPRGAVRGLLDRAKAELREILGSMSRFLSAR